MNDDQDSGSTPKPDDTAGQQISRLYEQLSRYAARLMVVHEAGRILRSTTDREELARELLKAIAEPLFASSGCVARFDGDELSILAAQGLSEAEVEKLVATPTEAAVWFAVADGRQARTKKELQALAASPELENAGPSATPGKEAATPPEPEFDLYVPLCTEDRVQGVLALGPRVDAQAYTSEDLDFAVSLASHLALAVDHAGLLEEKARRIEQLSVLLRISKEITSTLDLDRVLATIAHMTSMVIPNRRTVVALATGASVEIRASSQAGFDVKAARSDPLLGALRWAHAAKQRVNTCHQELQVALQADGRDVLLPLLESEGGPRGLAILPLEDDEGILGLLSIEADEDERPLSQEADELVTILANQTTVAIRNAELYQRVPMVGSLFGKSRTRTGTRARRWLWPGITAVALGMGLLVPLPAWVSGDASLRPAQPIAVRAATAGVVDEVLVKEGQAVPAGAVVGRLRRDELVVEREQVLAALQQARAKAAGARGSGNLTTYSVLQTEQQRLREEIQFLDRELQRTELVAPVDSVVLTPWVELRAGERLEKGDTFLELADLTHMEVEIDVPEEEIGVVTPGTSARLKVHAYPRRTFHGKVVTIAPLADEGRTFRVTVLIDNHDAALRPGMTGRAHVDIPSRPVLLTLLRPLLRWARLKLWI